MDSIAGLNNGNLKEWTHNITISNIWRHRNGDSNLLSRDHMTYDKYISRVWPFVQVPDYSKNSFVSSGGILLQFPMKNYIVIAIYTRFFYRIW